jgi:calcineurin-like phosphoesterase
VQTADEQVLPGGTGYITDLGMTGPHDGVIGMQTSIVIERFLKGIAPRFEPSEGNIKMNGLIVDIDPETGHALQVERISLNHK